MTAGFARLAAEFLLQAQALPDTIITKQVAVEQGAFTKVATVAQGLMSIAILALTVVLIPAAWNFRSSYKKVNELIDRFYGDIGPLVRNANAVADNVNYITTAIRVDVQQFNQTVTLANERLTTAVKTAERRLNELDALMRVVQREAEDAFVSTASTLRGVRAGATTLRDQVENGVNADTEHHDEDEVFDESEETQGDYGETESEWHERPRVRPRTTEERSGSAGRSADGGGARRHDWRRCCTDAASRSERASAPIARCPGSRRRRGGRRSVGEQAWTARSEMGGEARRRAVGPRPGGHRP